jgi:hypothetical protein
VRSSPSKVRFVDLDTLARQTSGCFSCNVAHCCTCDLSVSTVTLPFSRGKNGRSLIGCALLASVCTNFDFFARGVFAGYSYASPLPLRNRPEVCRPSSPSALRFARSLRHLFCGRSFMHAHTRTHTHAHGEPYTRTLPHTHAHARTHTLFSRAVNIFSGPLRGAATHHPSSSSCRRTDPTPSSRTAAFSW